MSLLCVAQVARKPAHPSGVPFTEAIEQHIDLHALARPLGQCGGKFAADVDRSINVDLEGDRHLGSADAYPHRPEISSPISSA